MDDKPGGALAGAALVVPLVALCCLGPAVLGSFLGGLLAWIGGLGLAEIAGAAIVVGLMAYGLVRWRKLRHRRGGASQACEPSEMACASDNRPNAAAEK